MASIEKQLSVSNRIAKYHIDNFKKLGQAKMTEGACKTRIEMLQGLWSEFDTNHWIIHDDDEADTSDNYFTNDVYNQTEESYLNNLGCFRDHLTNLQLARATATVETNAGAPESLNLRDKLPIITLPTFSGEIHEWVRFRDTFTEMIVRKPNLAPVYKMHYLNQALSGEAAKLLEEIPASGDNFADAWKLIKDHYDNTRLLITKLLSKLMSIPPMSLPEAHEISRILTTTKNILKALKAAGSPVDQSDHFTVFITTSRLSPILQSNWEKIISRSEAPQTPPKFETLIKFLESERLSFIQLESAKESQCSNNLIFKDVESNRTNNKVTSKSKSANLAQNGKSTSSCSLCKNQHFIINCESFLAKSPYERKQCAVKKQLCFNCLGRHNAQDCKNNKRCKQCSSKHHSLLHFENNKKVEDQPIKDPDRLDKNNSSSTHHLSLKPSNVEPALNEVNVRNSDSVLLATAWIHVQSVDGVKHLSRALIDQGAQSSFITERLCQFLNLKRKSVRVSITGIDGDKEHLCKSTVELTVQPHFDSNFFCNVKDYVIPKITTYKPLTDSSTDWQHLKGIILADPNFGGSERIDILLGA